MLARLSISGVNLFRILGGHSLPFNGEPEGIGRDARDEPNIEGTRPLRPIGIDVHALDW